MQLEQEMASIMAYVLKEAGNPAAYYWDVPASFQVPSVYFPVPEMESGGDTFVTYFVDYAWYIKMFDSTEQRAHMMGNRVLQSIRADRNLIPLIGQDGKEIPCSWVRVNDPSLKPLDNGAAQLAVTWRSRRPYRMEGATKAMTFYLDVHMESGKAMEDAFAEALGMYALKEGYDGKGKEGLGKGK